MATIHNSQLEKVYTSKTRDEAKAAYDSWAERYESDVLSYGLRLHVAIAASWTRLVSPDDGPILDAGCGTGLQSEPLHWHGYGPIIGIDLSERMLAYAGQKGIYADLQQMALGSTLDFPDDHFAHTISNGVITPGHAPANSFDELIRVTRPGGLIVFSLRVDDGQDPAYPEAIAEHVRDGDWELVHETETFPTMPIAEPDVFSRIYAYKVRWLAHSTL